MGRQLHPLEAVRTANQALRRQVERVEAKLKAGRQRGPANWLTSKLMTDTDPALYLSESNGNW